MHNVEPNGGVVIFDPEDMEKTESEADSEIEEVPRITMLGYGGDGGGSNSPSRRRVSKLDFVHSGGIAQRVYESMEHGP